MNTKKITHSMVLKLNGLLEIKPGGNQFEFNFKDTADHQGHYSKHGSDNKKHYSGNEESNKGSQYDAAFKVGHNNNKGSRLIPLLSYLL